MIKKAVQDAINEQITKEFYSSYLYLSMAAYYHELNLDGFANWMHVQVQEENFHAMKFFDYLLSRDGEIKLNSIDAPPQKWSSPLEAFEEAYKHEQKVTASINNLADVALKEGDHATTILLQWFITEQVEEESNVKRVVELLKMTGGTGPGLFMIDNELKTRVFTPPAATA